MRQKLQTIASLLAAVVTMCLLFVGVSAAQLIDPPVYLDPSDQSIDVGQIVTGHFERGFQFAPGSRLDE